MPNAPLLINQKRFKQMVATYYATVEHREGVDFATINGTQFAAIR